MTTPRAQLQAQVQAQAPDNGPSGSRSPSQASQASLPSESTPTQSRQGSTPRHNTRSKGKAQARSQEGNNPNQTRAELRGIIQAMQETREDADQVNVELEKRLNVRNDQYNQLLDRIKQLESSGPRKSAPPPASREPTVSRAPTASRDPTPASRSPTASRASNLSRQQPRNAQFRIKPQTEGATIRPTIEQPVFSEADGDASSVSDRPFVNPRMVRESTAPRATRPPSGSAKEWKSRITPKFDPLDDGINPTFKKWKFSIMDRLELNSDHYRTTRAQQAEVWGNTTGQAQTYLEPRYGSEEDPFVRASEMIQLLESYYVTGNEVQEKKDAFKAFQWGAPFDTYTKFKAEFISLATQRRLPKTEWFDEFWDKLSSPLRMASLGWKGSWNGNFAVMTNHISEIDLERRQNLVRNTTATSGHTRTPAAARAEKTPRNTIFSSPRRDTSAGGVPRTAPPPVRTTPGLYVVPQRKDGARVPSTVHRRLELNVTTAMKLVIGARSAPTLVRSMKLILLRRNHSRKLEKRRMTRMKIRRETTRPRERLLPRSTQVGSV